MRLYELVQYLEETVPLCLQEDYDNSGLLLGNPEMEIEGGLICLDITESIIQEALELKVNLIISHHPLIFQGFRNLNPKITSHRLILKALEHEIAIYAIHTNLDKIHGGISFQIGEILGLKKLGFLSSSYSWEVPEPVKPIPGTVNKNFSGLGVIGSYEPYKSWMEFCKILKQEMRVQVIRHTAPVIDKISKVGLCGGSGSEFIQKAIHEGCQVFLTADLKYHQFFLDYPDFILVDIGHYETEQFSPQLIKNIISKKFPTFALSLTKLNTNPIYYSY